MTAPNTPGQIAYATFWQACAAAFGADVDAWDTIHAGTQRAWEAAAQAVLEGTVPAPLRPAGDAAAAGACCPACGGTALAWGLWGPQPPQAVRQEVACRQCQALWTAVYARAGYAGLTRHGDAP